MKANRIGGAVAGAVLAGAMMASTAAMADVHLTMDLSVKPDQQEQFLKVMTQAAHDTRSFKGNKLFHILVDKEKPGHILFYEIWDSPEHLQAYRDWRGETKFGDKIAPYMAGPVTTVMYDIAE